MPKKYNFSTCCDLLSTNPKTFKVWLEKAQIDPRKQVNAADPREKCLTREQVEMLAKEYERILPPLDEDKPKAVAPTMTIEALAEQLAATHAQTTTLLETNQAQMTTQLAATHAQMTTLLETNHALLTEMTHSFRHILSLVQEQGDHRQRFDQVEQHREEPSVDAVPGVQSVPEAAPSSSTPSTPTKRAATKGTSTSTASRSSKPRGKGKSLPRTLIPLRVFADQHQIEMNVADRASESKKIAVVRGRWLFNSRLVAKALDDAGKRSFYTYFWSQEGFTRCEQCPHGAEEQPGSSAG